MRAGLRRRGYALVRVGDDSHHLVSRVDDRRPLPEGAQRSLRPDAPRLEELRRAYDDLDLDVTSHSQWREERVRREVDLRYFRGDSPIVWHYLDDPEATRLRYFTYLRSLEERDDAGLLEALVEDGAFGCWTFEFPGRPTVSRDLLDAVNELLFLDAHLDALSAPGLRVLDIGAGYGRLAHRFATAAAGLVDYCCVDAVPESTFLCEYYLRYREAAPPCRVVPLHEVAAGALDADRFDLAVNVHSFSECTFAAVRWWVDRLVTWQVPTLFLVPNDSTELLTTEPDGTRRDFAPLLHDAGYRLEVREPVLADPAVRELVGVHDRFHLFRHGSFR